MGAEPTGVHVVVSTEYQVAVVSVAGEVATTAQAHEVADRLLDVVPADGPVIVDLSRLVVAPDELAWLILRFEAAPHWHRFRLVDDCIDHRRQLRQLCRRVLVLSDVATALAGARTEVPAGTPVLDIVDLWGGTQPASAPTSPTTTAPTSPTSATSPTTTAPRSSRHPSPGHPSRPRSLGPRE